MNGRARTLTLFAVFLLFLSCQREGSTRAPATSDTGVAPSTAGSTDTSYVGGGGSNTTSTGPTSTDTAGTSAGLTTSSGGSTSTARTSDVGGGGSKATSKKARTEPGSPGKKH